MTRETGAAGRRGLAMTMAMSLGLANCSYMSDSLRGRTIGMSGAGTVLDKPFEPYDEAKLKSLIVSASPAGLADTSTLDSTIGSFSAALYKAPSGGSGTQNQMRDARNEVQGMLLTTSANRCNAFKQLLRARSTNMSFALGTLSTVLGAAGAIVTGGASQALSGAAGAATGVGAEYNKDIMASVTSSVIIPGIDKQRSSILQEIANRRCLGISSYDLAQAMNDAIRYNSACSTDVGVAAASSALSQSTTTGPTSLADAKATIDAVKALHTDLTSTGDSAGSSAGAGGGTQGQAKGDAAGKTPKATTDSTGGTKSPADASGTASAPQDKVLVGEPVNYLQCPSLMADGTLPKAAVPTASATTGQKQYGEP